MGPYSVVPFMRKKQKSRVNTYVRMSFLDRRGKLFFATLLTFAIEDAV